MPPFPVPSPQVLAATLLLLSASAAQVLAVDPALEKRGLDGLEPVPFTALSSRAVSPLADEAFALRTGEWKHAETENFVYHYFHSHVATPVSVEAEFHHRVVTGELGAEAGSPLPKCHVFVFEESETWDQFKTHARLDPWTGGIHAAGELFLLRDRSAKFKGNTLGHEVAHLILFRTIGATLPLWVNEGFAEYASSVGHASFHRARGYDARPRSSAVAEADFIPLRLLTAASSYPEGGKAVDAFYAESERLVRFLVAKDKPAFLRLLKSLGEGTALEPALAGAYGPGLATLDALEKQFRPYAIGDRTDPRP